VTDMNRGRSVASRRTDSQSVLSVFASEAPFTGGPFAGGKNSNDTSVVHRVLIGRSALIAPSSCDMSALSLRLSLGLSIGVVYASSPTGNPNATAQFFS
jgi:hypothetical protein